MSHSCVENYIHIIFSTKDRKPLITPEIESRLYAYLGGIARKNDTTILKINGMPDHIHILLKLHPSIALANLVKELKSYSSSWMKQMGSSKFGWQAGYGAFSYSKSILPAVSKYIEKQKDHHKIKTFQDEIKKLQEVWGIEWTA